MSEASSQPPAAEAQEQLTDYPVAQEVVKSFRCHLCNIFAKYHYFGTRPIERHFSSSSKRADEFVLMEKSYVCDDPFSEPKPTNFLVLGSDCFACKRQVCVRAECSVFYYNKRFCLKCAESEVASGSGEFPTEVVNEINKMVQLRERKN